MLAISRYYLQLTAVIIMVTSLIIIYGRSSPDYKLFSYSYSIIVLSTGVATCYVTRLSCLTLPLLVSLTLMVVWNRKHLSPHDLYWVPPLVIVVSTVVGIYYSVGGGRWIPVGYDEWSDLASAHYIMKSGGLEESRLIRGGYYYYPIMSIIESGIIWLTGLDPFRIPLFLSLTIIYVVLIILYRVVAGGDGKDAMIIGSVIILLLVFSNPRLRFWDIVSHLAVSVYFLSLFYLLEREKVSLGIVTVFAVTGIIMHLVFLLFVLYYIAREIIMRKTRYSGAKIHILAVILLVSYVYYSSTGVINYLIGEVFNVSVYKRIPATLAAGAVPVYSYLIPLALFTLPVLVYSGSRRKLTNVVAASMTMIGILLGLSGKSNYGRHLASSGYEFLYIEDIDTRRFLGAIALTVTGLFFVSGLLTVAYIDSGSTMDWAPHKYCSNSFSVPCIRDANSSRELALLIDAESLIGYRLVPEPRIEPALVYFLVIENISGKDLVDSKIVRASKDSRIYPPPDIDDYGNVILFYSIDGYATAPPEGDVWYIGYNRVLVNVKP